MRKPLAFLLVALGLASGVARGDDAKVVLIAGRPSHGPGEHEFNAGILLMEKCLKEVPGIAPAVVKGGWPKDESVFEGAKTVVFFMDGGDRHPMIVESRLETIRPLMQKGVGLVCLHYAVEFPKSVNADILAWLGGYYETGYSINPHWTADIARLPEHPVTRGVKPFKVDDEWYFNMRFREDGRGLTPILVATPDDETRTGKSSYPRGGYPHIAAAKGRPETIAWTFDRPDGGRSFGFTGAHNHRNWGNDDFRTLVLNAVAWTAKLDVPAGGVKSAVSATELEANLDPKGKK